MIQRFFTPLQAGGMRMVFGARSIRTKSDHPRAFPEWPKKEKK
jgi:hypothetical protein